MRLAPQPQAVEEGRRWGRAARRHVRACVRTRRERGLLVEGGGDGARARAAELLEVRGAAALVQGGGGEVGVGQGRLGGAGVATE
eukprot:1148188-Pelagomonas_calceolata.AAC.9